MTKQKAKEILSLYVQSYIKDEDRLKIAYKCINKLYIPKKRKKSISIPIAYDEWAKMTEGEVFNWEFNGVKVQIYQGEE